MNPLAYTLPLYAVNNSYYERELPTGGSLSLFSINSKLLVLEKELSKIKGKILSLSKGWDEENAEPITKENWNRAEEFLKNTISKFPEIISPHVSPVPNGEILIHWKNTKGQQLSFLIGEFTRYSFFDVQRDTILKGHEKGFEDLMQEFKEPSIF